MSLSTERKALEKTYNDKCNIYIFEKKNEGNFTHEVKMILFENVKCALSQKSLNTSKQSGMANAIVYDAKLFIAPELVIAPGSHIEVIKLLRVYKFVSSGEAFVYETHQEIMLLRNDKA